MRQDANFMYFNMASPVASGWTDDGNMYRSTQLMAMNSTAAGTATMYFEAIHNGHFDAPDDIVLTVDATGTDDADRANRVTAMDAMVSKANTRNRDGFVVAFSEIENVKPGGITGITVTLDS
tara:strand:- start:558 stop:923 length:366 start_codon:yes stop_codon:yes gene_type:complete